MADTTRWNTDPKVAPLRAQLAACTRLLHREKILNYSGHISVRIPERNAFLIQSFSESRAQVSPESLVMCDMDANVIEGPAGYKPPIEVFIHSEILRARPDTAGDRLFQLGLCRHLPHDLGQDRCPTFQCIGSIFKNHNAGTFTQDKAVTLSVEGTACRLRIIISG